MWDEEYWYKPLVRQLQSVRDAGLLVHLPIYLNSLGILATLRGDVATAASLISTSVRHGGRDARGGIPRVALQRREACVSISRGAGMARTGPPRSADSSGSAQAGLEPDLQRRHRVR
jgi:hypothetical protein